MPAKLQSKIRTPGWMPKNPSEEALTLSRYMNRPKAQRVPFGTTGMFEGALEPFVFSLSLFPLCGVLFSGSGHIMQ